MFGDIINLFTVLKTQGSLVKMSVYPAIEAETDPYEHTTSQTLLNPVSIDAVVTQIGFGALKWKYWGQLPTGSIQILTENKNYSLLISADRIVYKGNNYYCSRDDSKRFMILQRQDYLVAILERKYND